MEPPTSQDCEFSDVIDTLTSMFGNVISKEVIVAVVESYEGDLSYAADAIMNMSSDAVNINPPPPENSENMDNKTTAESQQQKTDTPILQTNVNPTSTTLSVTSNPVSTLLINESSGTVGQLIPAISYTEVPAISYTGASHIADAKPNTQETRAIDDIIPASDQTISHSEASQNTEAVPISQESSSVNQLLPAFAQATLSCSGASRSRGAVPKQLPNPRPPSSNAMIWTDQIRRIIGYHNQGSRILLLMRGVPGSGKSYLARNIVDITIGATALDHRTHVFSTDDYFMVRGQYQYDKGRLSDAHEWNRNRVRLALRQGLSPVIIDNTNIEIWEMEFYVREGVSNGYIIEVVEPNTPWAKKVGQLLRKNNHNVPAHTIRRMLDNYQDGITGDFLIRYYGLSYPGQMVPPVVRAIPEFIPLKPAQTRPAPSPPIIFMQQDLVYMPNQQPQQTNQNQENTESKASQSSQLHKKETICPNEVDDIKINLENTAENIQLQKYSEIQKQMEEFEKFEREWENGESWNEEARDAASRSRETSSILGPRPQRRTTAESSAPSQPTLKEKFIDTDQTCNDWTKIAMFMPSWADVKSQSQEPLLQELPEKEILKISSSTSVELGDADLKNPRKIFKIMSAVPRDINIFHIPQPEKMPEKRLLDKSTTTNEMLITEAFRCQNEEQHFVAFRKLFKNIPKAALRDIFDKCCGDVNWAVDIVLGGMAENQIQILGGSDGSDSEEDLPKKGQCNCLAAYQVGIDQSEVATGAQVHTATEQCIPIPANELHTPLKKAKVIPSVSNLLLKLQIEKNIVISNEHYSNHIMMLKNRKHRNSSNENSESNTLATTTTVEVGGETTEPQSNSSVDTSIQQSDSSKQTKDEACCQSDDEESNTSSYDDVERTVTIYLGREFITQLDYLFGRSGMTYPENVEPRVNIPVSLLNEINAFWMESLMYQLDEQDKQARKMMKEDEEFAQQLALKEAELAKQGKEPEVPDFKEIMDMDFALSLYQKDVADWRNKEPTDIAAIMSRDKLYNLFPEMSQEILSELLMAHDNNFQATVEVLLMSTGKADILQDKNGLNKFVMEKEMERQEKILEEEKKALSRVEWPFLPKGEKLEMSTVNQFREEAHKHLLRRNQHYQKAQEYIRRGMTQVASYYNEVAAFHKTRYEQSNSLAAASLIQVHAANSADNATIDLHYLRVAEAKESLDLFLDTHIQNLRQNAHRSVRVLTLFFITGRGRHSNGGPRVKPATKKRLRERGIAFTERNPGLLTARVSADDKLTYEVE